ncbi:MAG TPA: pyridoxamine 5'-phosphate oxidase family protein [Anaerolineales bacterium]|nr:pyridoxamine 5'-phosphate oxidase family protein [Anaerolineales bacterium]
MTNLIPTETVWNAIEKNLFAVLGMVTPKGEARTAGIVYIVHEHQLYISTQKQAWKTRHIAKNPSVSLTITLPKSIPFMPWIQIPAATITFSGQATVQDAEKVSPEILKKLFRGLQLDSDVVKTASVITVRPTGEFVTYGIGVSLMDMRFPEKARGRAQI